VKTGTVETKMGLIQCVVAKEVNVGDEVLLVVRPQGIIVSRTAAATANGNNLLGTIQAVSFVGDFQECHVTAADERLTVILDPYQDFKVGENVCLHVPTERLAVVAKL
jgi:ABC-type sugar transport system ATPase subunit